MSKSAAQKGLNALFNGLDDLALGLGKEIEIVLLHHFVSQGAKLKQSHLFQASRASRYELAMACLEHGVKPDVSSARNAMDSRKLMDSMLNAGLNLTDELIGLGFGCRNQAILRRFKSSEEKRHAADRALLADGAFSIWLLPQYIQTLVQEYGAKLPPGSFAKFCHITTLADTRDEVGAYLVRNGADYKEKYEYRSAQSWAETNKMTRTLAAIEHIERLERATTFKDDLEDIAAKARKGPKPVEPPKRRVF